MQPLSGPLEVLNFDKASPGLLELVHSFHDRFWLWNWVLRSLLGGTGNNLHSLFPGLF